MAQTTPGLTAAVSGDIWWGGFTAEITITNRSGADLSEWSYVFDSPHQLNSAPWGATLQAEPLDNGLTRYTLSGSSWGANIPAGGSMTVGFNGLQGVDLGVNGALSQDLLMVDVTPTSGVGPAPDLAPTPAPVVESEPEPVAAEPEPIEVIEAVELAPVVDVLDPSD
jgi:Cellulose binding domain.